MRFSLLESNIFYLIFNIFNLYLIAFYIINLYLNRFIERIITFDEVAKDKLIGELLKYKSEVDKMKSINDFNDFESFLYESINIKREDKKIKFSDYGDIFMMMKRKNMKELTSIKSILNKKNFQMKDFTLYCDKLKR